jgi:hypothetical protein
MLKQIALPAASAFALAAIALSPAPASASWISGAAATAQTAQAGLSNVIDVHRRRHSHRYHGFWWGAPLAFAPYAYYSNPGWHYQYFGPHKRRCGYTHWGYTCW